MLIAVQLVSLFKVYAQDVDRTIILAVTVNGLPGNPGVLFLQDGLGNLYATAAFLDSWNLRIGNERMQGLDGTEYFQLPGSDGSTYVWNHARAELHINVEGDMFLPTRIELGLGSDKDVAPYTAGAYLNYDVALTQSPGAHTNAALFDLALFAGEGLLTSSHITGTDGRARLMTTWQKDRVRAFKTLRIGDSYNNTSSWGRGVLFGGIQYGTNFAVRPDFIPFATPSVSGTALLPATVDVYVDNALRSRNQVNAGPFTIQNLPVITGAGDIEVVVKDVLGREQLLTQPFFASPVLLRKGLVDDSFELGWLRQNYGLDSNDYKNPFAAVNYRKGLSDSVTGEASMQLQRGIQTAGASIAATLPGLASVVESSFALSAASGLATGAMASVRYSYLGPRWSANIRMQLYNDSFRQLGSDAAPLPQQIVTAQLSTPLGNGTLSVNYLRQLNQGESLTRIINTSYSRKISANSFASFTLVKPLSNSGGTVAALTLIFIAGKNHVGSATLNSQSGGPALSSEFQRSTPPGIGTGYRVAAMRGRGFSRQEASLTRNQNFGTLQVDTVRLNQETSARQNVSGSIATLGNGVHFARRLDQGFALVQTGDIPGVPVLLENQVVAHTNSKGRALVRNLQSYQSNRISIDPLLLPLETSIGAVEQTVVPRSQGGVFVDFAVSRSHSAILTIVQSDGTLMPSWTPVEVVGMASRYVVGKRGEVFVELPELIGNRIIARPIAGPVCELRVDQAIGGSTAPFLGPLTCPR